MDGRKRAAPGREAPPARYPRSAAQRGMRSRSTPIRSRIRATTKSTGTETDAGRWWKPGWFAGRMTVPARASRSMLSRCTAESGVSRAHPSRRQTPGAPLLPDARTISVAAHRIGGDKQLTCIRVIIRFPYPLLERGRKRARERRVRGAAPSAVWIPAHLTAIPGPRDPNSDLLGPGAEALLSPRVCGAVSHRFAKRGRGDAGFDKANASRGAQAYLTVRRAPRPRSTQAKPVDPRPQPWDAGSNYGDPE